MHLVTSHVDEWVVEGVVVRHASQQEDNGKEAEEAYDEDDDPTSEGFGEGVFSVLPGVRV